MVLTVYLGAENSETLPTVDAHNNKYDKKEVKMLNVQNNLLKADALQMFVQFQKLVSLDLSKNELDDDLIASLIVPPTLESLDLSSNRYFHSPLFAQACQYHTRGAGEHYKYNCCLTTFTT